MAACNQYQALQRSTCNDTICNNLLFLYKIVWWAKALLFTSLCLPTQYVFLPYLIMSKLCIASSIEERVKQMEARIMTLVEESCMLSARTDPDDETAPKKEVDLGQVS